MEREKLENILNIMTETGSDYADIFIENTKTRIIKLLDNKIDSVKTDIINGLGLRMCDGHNTYYSSLNKMDDKNILNSATKLSKSMNKSRVLDKIKLKDLQVNKREDVKTLSDLEKKDYLLKINTYARNYSDKISQVFATISDVIQNVKIANTDANHIKDTRFLKRLTIIVYAKENDKLTQSVFSRGTNSDYSFLDDIDLESVINNLCETTIKKLTAPYAPSGKMPVIIGNDSGVLIHEACGHALEATSVADNASVLADSYLKKVASEKVTIIDDATIPNFFGTLDYDDEGNKTRKNILIENGVVKSFLVDRKNAKRMNHSITSSGRREDYKIAPTSRMNNTYLDNGCDSFSDMVKSIDFGIYAKKMGGGEVHPTTGDFNFGVDEAYIIRNGKIEEMVVGASLIGNIKEVLGNIEMISDDLNFAVGLCGSESGWCPVTDGQPSIKLSSILVGGKNE